MKWRGIHEILKQCLDLNIRMSGVYIDGKFGGLYHWRLKIRRKNMAVIHIEKANRKFVVCISSSTKEFLVQEF